MAPFTFVLLNLAVASGAVIQTGQESDFDEPYTLHPDWKSLGSQQLSAREADLDELMYNHMAYDVDPAGREKNDFRSYGRTIYKTKRFINPFNYIGSIFDENYDMTK